METTHHRGATELKLYRLWGSDGDKLPSVNKLLTQLLDGMVDYAGLFPPAKLELEAALAEFVGLKDDRSWMVDLFVCPSNKLQDLDALCRRKGIEGFGVSVIGNPLEEPDKTMASLERDIQRMEGCVNLEFGAYEVKVSAHEDGPIHRALKAIDRAGLGELVDDVYVEFAWNSHLEDSLHDLAAVNPNFGAKARTGGVTADLFPSVADVAHFIHTAVSIEIPFKMTAGLHDPLRHLDADLGVHRHGFLNICLASAFALAGDIPTSEIERILMIEDGKLIKLTDDRIAVGANELSDQDIELFQDWFGGFGSCSVDEPVDGLKKLGYW